MQKIRNNFPTTKPIIGFTSKADEIEITPSGGPPYKGSGYVVAAITGKNTREWLANFHHADQAEDFVNLLQAVYQTGVNHGIEASMMD